MQRPLIGINTDLQEDDKGPSYFLRARYTEALWQAGGQPVILPPLPRVDPLASLRSVQGLILIGGDDLSPERYGARTRHPGEVPLHPDREVFDLALVQAAIRSQIPTLAICLGMQELCVVSGGALHAFIPDSVANPLPHRTESGGIVYHPLEVAPESKLFQCLGARPEVMSAHRQGVKEPGQGLIAVAKTADGVIEAVEGRGPSLLMGVQWHPEMMLDQAGQAALFSMLVEEAQQRGPGPN